MGKKKTSCQEDLLSSILSLVTDSSEIMVCGIMQITTWSLLEIWRQMEAKCVLVYNRTNERQY